MNPRFERILAWLTLVVSVGVIAVALVEVDRRSEDGDQAIAPTAVPSPTSVAGSPSPGAATATPTLQPISPAIATEPAAATAAATATAAPPATPSPTPVPAVAPTPVVPPQASPVPVTGGGAMPAGLALVVFGLALGVAVRRAY